MTFDSDDPAGIEADGRLRDTITRDISVIHPFRKLGYDANDDSHRAHEPDPTGWDITEAINAAALNNHTEYDHNPDEYDPYDQQLPDTGHEIDW